ncbi:MAG: SRPBCC domain-containing protein [Methyloceanibacter sp.]
MAANAESSADREIVIARLIDAPPARVFDAWTDPQQVVQWWGPRGFTTTTSKMDVKPGGVWGFVMHGPDGRDYQNRITYLEVVKPERLVYKHGGDEDLEPVSFQTTVTFVPQGSKTMVTMRAVFPTAEERNRVVKEYGAVEGGKQTLARLDEHLSGAARSTPTSRAFVISRVFDAPRDLVWKAHSELEGLKHWWGPKGFTWLTGTLDFCPGGMFHDGLRSPNGQEMWGRFVYREIVAPERIVSVSSFSDPKGGVTRHFLSPEWPLEMQNTAAFSEAQGKTTLTISSVAINATERERKIFEDGFGSMQGGFTGTLDQLAAYLAKIV